MNNRFPWRKRWSFAAIFTLTLVLTIVFSFSTYTYKTLAQNATSYPRNQALYVIAQDGTKIAIDVWLPQDLSLGTKIPTLMRTTPYYRAMELVDKSKQNDPNATEINPYYLNPGYTDYFNNASYAVVLVDVRGSGASFGNLVPNPSTSKNEIQDYNAVVNWIVAQPWSNQKVGAFGTSAEGSTAEFLTVTKFPVG